MDQFENHPLRKASIDHTWVENDTMLVEWSGESDVEYLPKAVDTYTIEGDQITRHTT